MRLFGLRNNAGNDGGAGADSYSGWIRKKSPALSWTLDPFRFQHCPLRREDFLETRLGQVDQTV